MTINPKYLDLTLDTAGIRNSLKRLKSLVDEFAIDPLKEHQDDLIGNFTLIEEILLKRIANVIAYWCINKHDPVKPTSQSLMNDITNARRADITLEAFYIEQVTGALHTLSPILRIKVPDHFVVNTDELEYALLELEEKIESEGINTRLSTDQLSESPDDGDKSYDDIMYGVEIDEFEETYKKPIVELKKTFSTMSVTSPELENIKKPNLPYVPAPAKSQSTKEAEEKSIVVTPNTNIQAVKQNIQMNILNVSAEDTWGMIYNLMGFPSDYIQTKMLPRWQQHPDSFEKDRRFLYQMFIKTIQNTAGMQVIAGNFLFSEGRMTIDQLWNYYFSDLSQNIAPKLAVARFDNVVNETRWQRLMRPFFGNIRNISPIWLLALVIALIFDGLTTYVSLDQTPMDGITVMLFTLLITALFQIADILVINYRQREFEADAMIAKYQAKFEQQTQMIASLDTTSDSYVQFSMNRSQAQADLKAAEDNRQMAKRGRFWSARIADINVIVTAYGFAFMFLNAEEPMQALFQQFDYIFVQQTYENINVWVFLMVGLAITVSFVINTAQRTEILGWTMKRLKSEA
jgi:hypothetical protein